MIYLYRFYYYIQIILLSRGIKYILTTSIQKVYIISMTINIGYYA